MWLDNNYYKELLRIIQQMAQGSFQFEQNRLESFQGKKYRQLTDALLQVKSHSQKQINATAQMIESVIDGSYTTVRAGERPDNDYRAVYDKYNKLTKHLDRIDRHIARAQKGITENGKIDSRIDSEYHGRSTRSVCLRSNQGGKGGRYRRAARWTGKG